MKHSIEILLRQWNKYFDELSEAITKEKGSTRCGYYGYEPKASDIIRQNMGDIVNAVCVLKNAGSENGGKSLQDE